MSRSNRRFVLASSDRRPKAYRTIERHSKGGSPTLLWRLFKIDSEGLLLTPLGLEVKKLLQSTTLEERP